MTLQRVSILAGEAILPVLEAAGRQLEYLGIRSLDPMAPPGGGGLLRGLRALRQRSNRAELGELFIVPVFGMEPEAREAVEIMGPPRRFGIRTTMAWARCGEAVECISGRFGVRAREAGAPVPRPGPVPAQEQRQAEEAAPRPAHPVDEAGDRPEGLAPSTATSALRWSLQRMLDGASGRGGYDIGACGASSSAALGCGKPDGGARSNAASGRLQLLLLSGPPAASLAQAPPELERWVYHGEGHELISGGGLFSWESLRAVQPLPSLGAMLVACDLAGPPSQAGEASSLRPDDGGAPSAGVQAVQLPRGCLPEHLVDQPLQLSLELQKQIMCGVLEALQADWDAQAAGPGGLGGGFSPEALLWLQAVREGVKQGLPGALWSGAQPAAAVSSVALGEVASPGPAEVPPS
ncbi:hypothetical protein GPECTOR_61g850 [Gonium pectorale]|uniref:Uncharacterized protein n=1 Tax=Gonium pectorale TaxID=33097 RepID=A0A150G4W7_GONPE|nr:hypothetical protein GPECTOR_61g850 [Gonium pectorale]|eukprot:KXZ44897.1 hypothetical protein GPECTOR_61g850 [Gonium pectorale]